MRSFRPLPSCYVDMISSSWAPFQAYPLSGESYQNLRFVTMAIMLSVQLVLCKRAIIRNSAGLLLTDLRMVFGRSYEDRYIIPSSWYAIWQFSSNIGLMAGGLICGWLQDRIRRRWSLFWTSMLISVSVAICYVSDLSPSLNGKRGLFFVAKTVRGVGIGGMMCSTQTWLVR